MFLSALLLSLSLGATDPAIPAARVEKPEAVTLRAVEAARSGRWRDFAETLHPEAREQLKSLMLLLVKTAGSEGKTLDPEVAEMFGISSLAQLEELDSIAVTERFFLGLEKQMPMIREILSGSRATVIGSVPEGDDIHLVQRSSVVISGREISKMEVVTLRLFKGEWKMLLNTDMAAMVEALADQASGDQELQKLP